MPRTRKPQVLVRSSGWKATKRKAQTSEKTAAYLTVETSTVQPPGIHSSPPRPANTAAADIGAACHSSPAAAPLLPRPAGASGLAADASSEHETAAHVADLGPDTVPCQWPAVLALLPNGCISGIIRRAALSSDPHCTHNSPTRPKALPLS